VSIEYQVELCNTLGVDEWFNVPHLVDDYIFDMALMAENCSPRMKGLYQNLLKALSLAGGTTFAAFCHIGYDSRY